jgi:hypothetical protein
MLLTALAGQPGIIAGPLTDVTVDGYTGKYVELTVATDIATCTVDNGTHPVRILALGLARRRSPNPLVAT